MQLGDTFSKLKLVLITLLFCACSPAQADQLSFDQFPAGTVYKGQAHLPDFSGRDRKFVDYRTRIREGLSKGPNFAGHYSVIQFGCGTECTFVYVADNQTGKIFQFPLGGDDNLDLDLSFELNSRLLIAQWANDKDECKLEFFDWDRNEAKLLDTKILGRKDVCLSRHASDPVAADEPVKNLPAEFIGGWIQISAEITQCPSPTSGDLFITQRGFKEYGEDECGVDSVKAFPNSTVVRVDFDCGGEGQSWNSEEIMYVGDLGKIKVLVMTSLGSTDNRDDFGKPMPPEPDDGNPQVSVYLKCQ